MFFYWGGLCNTNLGPDASFDLEQWSPQKQGVKQRDAFLSIMGKMRFLSLTGCGGALNERRKLQRRNWAKEGVWQKNTIKIVVSEKMAVEQLRVYDAKTTGWTTGYAPETSRDESASGIRALFVIHFGSRQVPLFNLLLGMFFEE